MLKWSGWEYHQWVIDDSGQNSISQAQYSVHLSQFDQQTEYK